MRKLLIVGLVLVSSSLSAQTKRPATFDDVLNLKAVQGATVSPDGSQVIYTVAQWESEQDRMERRTRVWKVATSGSSPARQITFGEKGDSQPQWSPDGKYISFVSARGGAEAKAQIYLMPADGGEAWKLTDVKEGIPTSGGINYSWSPDGTRIAYTSTDPRSAEEEANIKKRDDERVFEGDFRYQHAWVVDVATKHVDADHRRHGLHPAGRALVVAGRQAVRVWRGHHTDAARQPSRHLRGHGRHETDREDQHELGQRRVAAMVAGRPHHCLGDRTQYHHAAAGRHRVERGPPERTWCCMTSNAKTIKNAAATTFDTEAGNPIWTNEGTRVLFMSGKRAYNEAFAYDVTTGRYTQLTDKRTINGTSVSKDGKTIVLTMDAPDAATEIYVTDPSFANPRRFTNTNPQVADLALGQTEVITWKSSDGVEIEGVLLKPVGFEAGKRYPTLVVAHGGPAGAYVNGNRLGGLEGGQVYAAKGWAVFYPNPRGSSNYGQKTLAANVNDWGGGDFKDIMTGVDALVARGISDPDKLAHIGWSYGGYMTAWVITQTTRFKAAMVGAGLTNMWSMYGTNDIPSVLIAYFGGIPNKQTLPLYLDRSAMTHIDKATTPTLILHGANDERVPVGQAYELYRGLKDRGKTTELVFYPREGHGITEYYHQKDRMQRIYDWVTKYHFRHRWKQNDSAIALYEASEMP